MTSKSKIFLFGRLLKYSVSFQRKMQAKMLYVVDGTYRYVMKITIVISISLYINRGDIRFQC